MTYSFSRKYLYTGIAYVYVLRYVYVLISRVGKLAPRLCRLIMYPVGDLRIETYRERISAFMNIACSDSRSETANQLQETTLII